MKKIRGVKSGDLVGHFSGIKIKNCSFFAKRAPSKFLFPGFRYFIVRASVIQLYAHS